MAEAGALAIEWAVLDAQYFGIPQRRRRVFVIAIFDPVLAERSPSPLLPVAESLPRHLAKGKQKRKSAATTLTESTGTDDAIVNAIGASIYHKSTVVNQDVNSGHLMVEGFTPSSFANYADGVGTLRSNGGDMGGERNIVSSLQARDYKGVGNQYVQEGKLVIEPMLAFDTQFDSNANVTEDVAPTLKASQQSSSVAYAIQGNVIGRQDHNGPAGKGHTEDGDPMFTLTSTDIHAVAYPIDTRNALRDPEKYDAQNRQGLGIGADGDPMATLTSAHVNAVAFSHYDSQVTVGEVSPTLRSGTNGTGHAVAYDEYNDTTNEVHHALRAGTKQSTGVLLGSEVAATLRSGGDGGVPSSRGEHLVTEPTMAVRRLTPLECERLMGWPDDHTRYKADGTEQADTHRYKQCGNGVASPVAQWIAKHLLNI
jgi:site-specific DNA-cytosine methylase